jgi:hypothetical protein
MQNYQGNSKAWSSLFIWKTHTVRHRTMMLEFAKLTKSKKVWHLKIEHTNQKRLQMTNVKV